MIKFLTFDSNSTSVFFESDVLKRLFHIGKSGIFENNGLTIGEQKNAIEKFYTLLLTEFCDMIFVPYSGFKQIPEMNV